MALTRAYHTLRGVSLSSCLVEVFNMVLAVCVAVVRILWNYVANPTVNTQLLFSFLS